jgi:FixJ family two-component response regulator
VCRSAIVETLRGRGWSVVEQPTGLDLIYAISGIILGDQPALRPGIIVADAVSRGCNGETIARGLQELGLHIPIVLVANNPDKSPAVSGGAITVVDPADAAGTVASFEVLPPGP